MRNKDIGIPCIIDVLYDKLAEISTVIQFLSQSSQSVLEAAKRETSVPVEGIVKFEIILSSFTISESASSLLHNFGIVILSYLLHYNLTSWRLRRRYELLVNASRSVSFVSLPDILA